MSSAQCAPSIFSPSWNFFECYSSPKERVDFTGNGLVSDGFQRSIPARESNGTIQKLMAEHMASSLIRNPSFTAAVAAAISERIVNHDPDAQ